MIVARTYVDTYSRNEPWTTLPLSIHNAKKKRLIINVEKSGWMDSGSSLDQSKTKIRWQLYHIVLSRYETFFAALNSAFASKDNWHPSFDWFVPIICLEERKIANPTLDENSNKMRRWVRRRFLTFSREMVKQA